MWWLSGIRKWWTRWQAGVAVVLAGLLFAGWAAVVTWPFVIHPLSTLTGPTWGDVAASVSKFEALRWGHQTPFTAANMSFIAYPDGPSNNIGVARVSALSELYLWVATRFLGAITAHSLMTYLGYVLTALVTFLFVRRVTRSALAGVVAGFIYGFWPHMYGIARADQTYTHMWLYILPLWAFWELATREFSWRWAAVAETRPAHETVLPAPPCCSRGRTPRALSLCLVERMRPADNR